MTNKEIYKRTLVFSLRRLLFDAISVIVLAGLCIGGFFIMDKASDRGLVGLLIGFIIGLILLAVAARFISYYFKAGQIAMMTRAIVEGGLPDDVYGEGKRAVKERFTTVAAFFAVTGVIKGIFRQLGRLVTKLGDSIGGDTGGTIGSAVSSAIQTIVGYLCDCCLGWVFFRKDQGAVRSTCEGAVLFFRHGKTLLRNAGRIFGMGLASLAVIGGAFTGIFYLVFINFPQAFERLSVEIMEAAVRMETEISTAWTDPKTLTVIAAAFAGLMIWTIVHSVFVRPFILTGVLRNYLESGMNDIPAESSFDELAGKSKKFAKLRERLSSDPNA